MAENTDHHDLRPVIVTPTWHIDTMQRDPVATHIPPGPGDRFRSVSAHRRVGEVAIGGAHPVADFLTTL